MKRLIERSEAEQFEFHRQIPVRVYTADGIQSARVQKTRTLIGQVLHGMQRGLSHEWFKVVELGCGTGDISGFFSWGHHVTGYDASPAAALKAKERFPWMEVKVEDIQKLEPFDCDLLILCETLEHLCDPIEFCNLWLPRARWAVLSSPLNGDQEIDLSAQSHIWSIEPNDFKSLLMSGGREVKHLEDFTMGSYKIALGASERG